MSLECFPKELKKVEYDGFTLWMDCREKLTAMAKYALTKGTADFQRNSYKKGKDKNCLQSSKKTYASAAKKPPKDQKSKHPHHNGHLVSANHLDYSQASIKDNMYMDNIFPQVARFNGSGGS